MEEASCSEFAMYKLLKKHFYYTHNVWKSLKKYNLQIQVTYYLSFRIKN